MILFSGQNGNHSSDNSNTEKIQWHYIDLSGNEQGPFTSKEMLDWYQDGYFFPADMVKRVDIDLEFIPLNVMIQWYGGRVPFTPGAHPPGPKMMQSMSRDIVPAIVPKMIPAALPAMDSKMIPTAASAMVPKMIPEAVTAIVPKMIPAADEQVKKKKYTAPKWADGLLKATEAKKKHDEMMQSMSQDLNFVKYQMSQLGTIQAIQYENSQNLLVKGLKVFTSISPFLNIKK